MFIHRENFKRVGNIVYRGYYRKLFRYAVAVLRQTRIPILKTNSLWIGVLQKNLLRYRLKFEEAIVQGKKEIKKQGADKNGLLVMLQSNREFVRALRDIGDGIAWRNLNFERPLLRVMSENVGHASISQDYKALDWRLGARRDRKDKVLINDLTHCLRIADLTVITRDGKILLYELKGDKAIDAGQIIQEMKEHRGDRWRQRQFRQNIRHWVAQMAFVERKVQVKGNQVHIIDLDFKIKTHIKTIKKLFRKANRVGSATALLEKGYYVGVGSFEKLYNTRNSGKIDEKIKEIISFSPSKNGWSNMTLPFSNYDTFYSNLGDWFRNITPYSVLPLSIKNCARLMMGQLYLQFYFDFGELKKRFEDVGWTVEISDLSVIKKQNEEAIKKMQAGQILMFDSMVNETIFKISKTDGNGLYKADLPVNRIMIMLSSFYKIDYVIDLMETAHINAQVRDVRGQYSAHNCIQEIKILK